MVGLGRKRRMTALTSPRSRSLGALDSDLASEGALARRAHPLRLGLSLLSVALLLAQPSSVWATAYSALNYTTLVNPPGYTATAVCDQEGIVDTATNYAQAVTKVYQGTGNCTGANQSLPSGWIGTYVSGYRDGAYCGSNGWSYSTVATSAWQVWVALCTNPAGTQTFHTVGAGKAWDSSGQYYGGVFHNSPSQNY